MKKFLSRFAAIAATTAMLASYATIPAYAAGLNGATAVIDAVDVTAARTVTLTLPAAAALTDTLGKVRIVVRDMAAATVNIPAGTTISNGAAMVVDEANRATGVLVAADAAGVDGIVAVTSLTIVFPANTFTANTSYQISAFTDLNGDGNYSDGDFASTVMVIGTSNTVVVSAQVEPTLTLNLTGATVDLGILSPAAVSTAATHPTATVATNALHGFTLQVTDDDGAVGGANAAAGLDSTTASTTIAAATDGAVTAGAAEFGIVVNETTDPQTNGSVTANPTLTTTGVTIATGTGATAGYVATVDVKAAISAITPAAADYTTSLTFTATAQF